MTMELNQLEKDSALWLKLSEYLLARIEAERTELEKLAISSEQTQVIRGKILAYRQILNKGRSRPQGNHHE